ncbi:MAG: amidohydrolase family protein, partial [Chloroflexi bacterium]|nr:amidohydrolase family protein [Chloroflexota bacterium]
DVLIEQGARVVCLDNLSSGLKTNISHLFQKESFRFIEHDVTEPIHIGEKIDFAPGYSLARVKAPPSFDGKTVMDLQLRQKYSINLVAIKRDAHDKGKKSEKEAIINVPMPNTIIYADDILMVAGSDSAWGNYKMGNHQAEIEDHVTGSMSTMEAIVATTKDAARSCWIDDRVGTLEEGKLADILVVDGDPITRIEDLRNVVDVYQEGSRVDRGDLV